MCVCGHVIEVINEERYAALPFNCADCGELVDIGDEYQHVEGVTDDGTATKVRHRAHVHCYEMQVMDVTEEGCFEFTSVEVLNEVFRE